MDNNTPWTSDVVSARLQNLFGDQPAPPSARAQAYREAAAVLVSFDMGRIRTKAGEAPSELEAIGALAPECEICYDDAGAQRWSLRLPLRRQVLKNLIASHRVDAAVAANPDRVQDAAQQQFEAYLGGKAAALESQTLDQLRGTERAAQLLERLVPGLPDAQKLRERIAFETLLQPFRLLAGDHFAGREKELGDLSDYVGVRRASGLREISSRVYEKFFSVNERPTLFINGPGGIGKSSLVAKFVLDHIGGPAAERVPFAYLDFDRPGLVAEEPITLLFEALRQLAVQFPASLDQVMTLRAEWNRRIDVQTDAGETAQRGGPADLRLSDRDYFLESFGFYVESLHVGQPLLLVVDTFEEIELQSQALVSEVFAFLDALQKRVPRLRTVLSGRVVPDTNYPTTPLTLKIFDPPSAAAYLVAHAKVTPEVAKAVAAQVGGSPMTLKLAVDVLKQPEEAASAGSDGITGLRTGLIAKLRGETIQSQLYTRILNHIKNDDEVRALAHPGLILRRITPPIIKEVLAGPCGVSVPDDDTARRLFERLARQVVLVTREGNDVLIHRPDLRAVMLEPLRVSAKDKVEQIHKNAVKFYTPFTDNTSRVEEFYHRLSLGFDPQTLNGRWIPGPEFVAAMKRGFAGALTELPDEAQAYLAARLEFEVDKNVWAKASQDDWETYVSRQAERQLQLGRPEEARQLIAQRDRSTWTPGSPLYAIDVDALIRMARRDEARSVVEDAIGRARSANRLDTPTGKRLLDQQHVLAETTRDAEAAQQSPQADVFVNRTLADALMDAVRTRPALERLLASGLGVKLGDIAPQSASLSRTVFAVVEWATLNRKLDELVVAARREFPGSVKLFRAAQEMGLEVDREVEAHYVQMQRDRRQVVNVDLFRRRLSELDAQVCRVAVRGPGAAQYGTGFLIAPDLVLTSDAVLAGLLGREIVKARKTDPQDVAFEFDRQGGASRIEPLRLASDWSVDAGGAGFVVVRVSNAIGGRSVSSRRARGWVDVRTNAEPVVVGSPLLVLYQGASEMVMSLEANGISQIDETRTRFRHTVPVPSTAVGAPCFNADFQIIGLLTPMSPAAPSTEVLSMTAILESMKKRGTDRFLNPAAAS